MSGSLFSGAVIPGQPTGTDTSTQYPLWLQQYTYNLANAAQNVASQPYTPFPGPEVATPSDATQAAWTMAQGDVGDWAPYSQQAASQIASAAPNLTGALSTIGNADPNLSGAEGMIANANPNLSGAESMIGSANPNLGYAQSLIAAGSAPVTGQEIQSYMSPYLGNVVGALQNASNINFTTNQLPAISSQFVSAGQSRSPQEMQADNNALYLSNQALDQSVAGALNTGYNTALSAAQQQQGVDISAGGALGTQQLQQGALQGQLGASLANTQLSQGQLGLQQGTALANTQLAQGQLGIQQGTAEGNLQLAGGQLNLQQGAAEGALGQLVQQEGGYDVGQVAAAGQAQDTVNQANINAAMNNFYSQEQWPYQNLSYASNIIRGQDVPSNTMQVGLTTPQTSYTASPLSSFTGTVLAGSALNNNTNSNSSSTGGLASLFNAEGGHITRKRALANDNRVRGALQRAA